MSTTPTSSQLPASSLPSVVDGVDDAFQKIRFLLHMAQRLEDDGNVVESVKSTETALLLRRNCERVHADLSARFDTPLLKQAQGLVLKCNSVAVESFQDNNFDTASFLLNKALFLTDDYAETNIFGDAEHDRLRLRAATFNNLGCLEKRRGRLHASLDHLQKAAQLEVSVDPDVGASPSTYLNLCTILNKLGSHVPAVSAAQRAVDTLRFQAQQGLDAYPNFPVMLAVAYYNLGASLESCDRAGDTAQAIEAYQSVLDTDRRYPLDGANTATVRQAADALRRLQGAQPNALVLPRVPQKAAGTAGGPRMFTTARQGQLQGASEGPLVPVPPSAKRSDSVTPYSLSGLRMMPPGGAAAGGGARPATTTLGDAAIRHAERIQARQRKKQAHAERDQMALQRAQKAHVREKEDKQRRERDAEAARREEMAKALYEKMVHGLRAEEIKRVKNAARRIQKVWRGAMARTFVKRMVRAATLAQAAVRSWLCRLRIHRTEEEKQQRAAREAHLKRQAVACIKIQELVRVFLRRLELIRQYRARKLRRHCSAKRIQRVFRSYCQRREERILAKLDAERHADEHRLQQQNNAAKKIQQMFRSFKMRRITRIVSMEQKRRAAAVTKLQTLVRGVLTRVWFRHYRMYRRQQELSSSKNLRVIIRIQAAWRCGLARRALKRRRTEKQYRERLALLFRSARRIQCAVRRFLALRLVKPLREQHLRRVAAVDKIQRRYIVFKTRQAYVKRRDARRQLRAASLIQLWYRECVITAKHREVARYHANIQRQSRLALLRTQSAVLLQAVLQAAMSTRIVHSVRNTFEKQSRIANIIQRAGRACVSRRDTAVLKLCAAKVDERRRISLQRHNAACIMQRATRCYLAKLRVHTRRIQRAASLMISKTYRMHRAKQELRRLRSERRVILEEKSAKVIQRLSRKFLRRLELKRLDAYYSEKNRQKIILMRKDEAAITIQAIWRGHATRRETTAERNRLLQNTIDAIRIQRQFRAYRFRTQINAEVNRRQASKKQRRLAAIKLQSFWRAVLAKEYVHVLQEARYNRTVCAIAIQCAWRRYAAQMELRRRRATRLAQTTLRAKQHDLWITSINTVAAALRTIHSGRQRLARLRYAIVAAVTEQKREEFLLIHSSATKIQAMYRGYYERVYARGLRREKREQERQEAERMARRNRAALTLQLAWRSAVARATTNSLRRAKRESIVAQQMALETVADPRDVVKRLFWSHEVTIKRDLTRERVERHSTADAAAIVIQRNVRMVLAIRRYKRQRENKQRAEAALRIQSSWREHEAEVARQQQQRGYEAAVRIQALMRGVNTRRHWKERQQRLTVRRGSAVELEDRRDQGAIKIQSLWRMWCAQSRARAIREVKRSREMLQLQHESARLIQKQFRGHLARRRVAQMRLDPRPPSPPPRH